MLKNVVIWKNGYVQVCCNRGYVLLDSYSFKSLPNRTLCIHISGKYAYFKLNNKQVKVHRYLMEIEDPKIQIDHINGNPLDNRMSNLRIATNAQNCKNRNNKKNSEVKYKGVTKTKQGNYMARIQSEGNRICLGRFDTPEEAAKAYNNYAKILHKEFAKLNKIDKK